MLFFRGSFDIDECDTDNKVAVDTRIYEKETEQVGSQTTFVPGSIHTEKVREFWRTELKAGEWVMDTLEYGYIIPFEKPPPKYEEANNKSALREMDFVYQ